MITKIECWPVFKQDFITLTEKLSKIANCNTHGATLLSWFLKLKTNFYVYLFNRLNGNG